MKPNQPIEDGKSEQPVTTEARLTPSSWEQFQLLLQNVITSGSTDCVIDILGALDSHLFHLAAKFPEKKFFAGNIQPVMRTQIETIEKTDIDSLLKTNVKPLTPLANPDSVVSRQTMFELEKQILQQGRIVFDPKATLEITKSNESKNFYILPIHFLSVDAAKKLLKTFEEKQNHYLAIYKSESYSDHPTAFKGLSYFDFIDLNAPRPIRWFINTSSTTAQDIKAFCLKSYVDNERLARSKVTSIRSELEGTKDPAQIEQLQRYLQVATEVLNFIRKAFTNSPLNEKKWPNESLSVSEAKTPTGPKRKSTGQEPASRKTKISAQPKPKSQSTPAFFSAKVDSAEAITQKTEKEIMSISTQLQSFSTVLATTDFTNPKEASRLIDIWEQLKSYTERTFEKAKKDLNPFKTEKAQSVIEEYDAHSKPLESGNMETNPTTVSTTATQPEEPGKFSISYLMN